MKPTLPLGIVVAENNVNVRDALGSEVEGFNLLRSHVNVNFSQAGIGLLLNKGWQLITQIFDFPWTKPNLPSHESFS
jgi:hypothetical protein